MMKLRHVAPRDPVRQAIAKEQGTRLRRARKAADISQEQLAAEVGMNRSQVIKHEKGGTEMRPETAERYRRFFSLPDDYFAVAWAPGESPPSLREQVGELVGRVEFLTQLTTELARRVEALERPGRQQRA